MLHEVFFFSQLATQIWVKNLDAAVYLITHNLKRRYVANCENNYAFSSYSSSNRSQIWVVTFDNNIHKLQPHWFRGVETKFVGILLAKVRRVQRAFRTVQNSKFGSSAPPCVLDFHHFYTIGISHHLRQILCVNSSRWNTFKNIFKTYINRIKSGYWEYWEKQQTRDGTR